MNKPTEPWLEDEQRELLSLLVRAHKTLIRAERQDFVLEPSLVRTQGVISRERVREALQNGVVGHGSQPIRREDDLPANWDQDLVYHKGLDGGVMPVLIGDLDALRLQNLLNFRDQTHFFITPDGLRYEASLSVEACIRKDVPMGLTEDRPHPKAFISYTWESEEHIAWVRQLAERLTGDGVLVTLGQWEVHPGDQLPQFMERAVRENDYVLVVCTPTYKRKSDQRQGGVGYEGDVITGELFSGANRRKFIPLHRSGTWKEAAPAWLAGSFYVGLDGTPYSEDNYNDLINTLHGLRPPPPPVGTPPTNPRPVRAAKGTASVASPGSLAPASTPTEDEPIRILNIVVDEVTKPRNDGTAGSALYTVPFQLSRKPSSTWAEVFVHTWNHPPEFTSKHRPGIGRVVGSKILLEGTTVEEVEQYHKKTLKLVVQRTNQIVEEHEAKQRRAAQIQRTREEEQKRSVREIAARISFDH